MGNNSCGCTGACSCSNSCSGQKPYYADACQVNQEHCDPVYLAHYNPIVKIQNEWAVPDSTSLLTLKISALIDILIGAILWNPDYGSYLIVSYDEEGQKIKVQKTSYNDVETGTVIPACTKFIITSSQEQSDNSSAFKIVTNQAELITASYSGCGEILIQSEIDLTEDTVINIPLTFHSCGSVVTNGFTLTVNSSFSAGLYQVFTAESGEVLFGAGSAIEIYPQWWGAVPNDSTDCTAAINKAIVSCKDTLGDVVLVGGVYKTLTPILILSNRTTLRGKSLLSVIHNAGSTDIIQIGDDITALADVRVTCLRMYTDTNVPGWNIRAWKARNTLIDNCKFGGGDATTGGIRMSESFCSRIVNNSFGGILGIGAFIDNASNAFSIIGNRFDGAVSYGVKAIHFSSRQGTITGNTIETWVDGIKLAGSGVVVSGNYFEDITGVGIKDHSTMDGLYISGCFFSTTGVAGISMPLTHGMVIKANHSTGVHSSGAFIQLNAPYPDATYDIGQNVYADAAEVQII